MNLVDLTTSFAQGERVYLASPFINRPVKINAHPSEVVKQPLQEEIITKGEFYQKPATYAKTLARESAPDILQNLTVSDTPEINYFNASSMSSSDLVEKCINNGYTVEEAVTMVRAKQAYGINESVFKNGVGLLSTHCCDA